MEVETLSPDYIISPKHRIKQFIRKYNQGPELLRQGILARWRSGSWDEREVIGGVICSDLVTVAGLPADPTQWRNWINDYA